MVTDILWFVGGLIVGFVITDYGVPMVEKLWTSVTGLFTSAESKVESVVEPSKTATPAATPTVNETAVNAAPPVPTEDK